MYSIIFLSLYIFLYFSLVVNAVLSVVWSRQSSVCVAYSSSVNRYWFVQLWIKSLSSSSLIPSPSLFYWVCSAIASVAPEVIDLSSSFSLAKDNSTVDSFSLSKRQVLIKLRNLLILLCFNSFKSLPFIYRVPTISNDSPEDYTVFKKRLYKQLRKL